MFEGCHTAIITPFKGTGIKTPVDWAAYREILESQNRGGVDGIVACGTTGESPTLSHREHNRVIDVTVEETKGLVMAGTGSNCTWEAIELTEHAEDVGVDASLQVCPYYNRPNQEGLYRHFGAVAEATDLPIIIYNIPSRSGREIAPATMARLREEYSNVVGVKEASGSEKVWGEIRERCGKDFLILSGNDSETLAMMRGHGAKGVISVASNIVPREIVEFTRLGLDGRFSEMEARQSELEELFRILFIDPNHMPVKAAMVMMGLRAGGYRLPMCEMGEENKARLRAVLESLGLVKG